MNPIHPKKLLHSKWTAVQPVNKEKHFMVTEVEFDEEGVVVDCVIEAGVVVDCVIEAVMSKRTESIDWTVLKNTDNWRQGWK
ncbi:TIGR02450 family Trp-rich protein [Spongiibacter sp. UBA1325]|uniref:TIGR02450 family Trp-rich protein n=1 Tax=Spongiibacter sp. UBA1325 TaxID=1947543 RepID=UPI00257CC049|nr:TIGR02450 family Trp-rich protein [Spongiibacter sp. UBA1325]